MDIVKEETAVAKIVELKNVTKVYKTGEREFHALDGVDLSIEKGKFVVILGPSGAGKSTLLNLIGGMDTPTTGHVIVNGEDISKYNEDKLSRYRAATVGFIFQFYNILPTLTVLENVELVKDIVKNPLDAHEALAKVGLTEHENKFPNQLSGGEQQRISIARAVAKNPKVLLCDEPTGALDYNTGRQILKLLQETCRKENMTVVLITHNSAITPMADHIIKMRSGRVIMDVHNDEPKNVEEIEFKGRQTRADEIVKAKSKEDVMKSFGAIRSWSCGGRQ